MQRRSCAWEGTRRETYVDATGQSVSQLQKNDHWLTLKSKLKLFKNLK